MAKYNLYMRDKTYVALVKHGAEVNPPKSVGKLINEILDRWANGIAGETPPQLVCVVCGSKATLQVFGKGQQKFFVCGNHKKMAHRTGVFKKLSEQ